jgi:hypothetical protein
LPEGLEKKRLDGLGTGLMISKSIRLKEHLYCKRSIKIQHFRPTKCSAAPPVFLEIPCRILASVAEEKGRSHIFDILSRSQSVTVIL